MRGTLITFEGGHGTGKSLAVDTAVAFFREQSVEPVIISDRHSEFGRALREVNLTRFQTVDPVVESLLVAAIRRETAITVREALDAGKIVLRERFTDAMMAFGLARGVDQELLRCLRLAIAPNLNTDLTFLMDAQVDIALPRSRLLSDGGHRVEREASTFHEELRQQYLRIAQSDPLRISVVDSTASLDDVRQAIRSILADRVTANPLTIAPCR